MVARSLIPRLTDIIEAIERVNGVLAVATLEEFENDWQRQWLVERGVEIISEASRRLPAQLRNSQPQIDWKPILGIGNVLRHEYDQIIDSIIYDAVRNKLPALKVAILAIDANLHEPEE